jgi:hypothetical protein
VKRNRLFYFVAGCVVVPLGLASRRYVTLLPELFALYAGDTLWALTAFLGFGFIFRRWSSLRVAAVALVFSYAVEISQLYDAPWIDNIRRTWLGGLVLGYGFLWSDILCYTAGVMLGAAVEVLLRKSPIGGGNLYLDTEPIEKPE